MGFAFGHQWVYPTGREAWTIPSMPANSKPRRTATRPAAKKGTAKEPAARKPAGPEKKHRIYTMSVASVYPAYLAKAERKGRTKAEVDEVFRWLTGYTQRQLDAHLAKKTDFEEFFAGATKLNPLRRNITGMICGVRIEAITDPLMQEVRYLDKLIDELAAGRPMEKILRTGA